MAYRITVSKIAKKQLKKLDPQVSLLITSWLKKNIAGTNNPRNHGKALVGDKKDFWRYRVGNYRVVCDIQQDKLVVLVVEVGHRKEIYRNLR